MKKVLALVLAAAMMLTLSVGALADDEGIDTQLSEVPIRVEGMAPGQEVESSTNNYYVNIDQHLVYLNYVSDYPITSIHFKSSCVATNWSDYDSKTYELGKSILAAEFDDKRLKINVTLPNPHEDIYSDTFRIKDTISFFLENGKKYDFPITIRFWNGVSKKISMVITDENGRDISEYERCSLPIGESIKFTVKVLDDAKISTPPYHIQLTGYLKGFSEDSDKLEDYYKISEVTMTENGTKGQFTVTNLGDPSDDFYRSYMNIEISLWDDSIEGNADTTCNTYFNIETRKQSESPNNPDDPDDPTTPNRPSNPSKDPDKTPAAPEATDNTANDEKTITAVASGEDTEVKLSNGSAGISADTINALGGHGSRLTIVNGGMSVNFPGGFNKVTEPGRIYFPFDYEEAPQYALEMLSAVKGTGVKSEARKVGGSMILPGSANVTLKTKLTGTVNIYLYDEDTGRYTAIATTTAKDGTVTFPTNQMGYMVLTTGRI